MSQELANQLRTVDAILADLWAEEQLLVEALEGIHVDLDNDAEAFTVTTGRSKEEFYKWRRRAKQAYLHKERRLNKVRELKRNAESERARVQMLLLSEKAGYRGEDPVRLLDALYLLSMDIVERTGVRLDEHETGLLMAVRLQCGYGAPGEKVS